MFDRLFFDINNQTDSSQVGAWIISKSGNLIDSQTIASTEWLQVVSLLTDAAGNKATITASGALNVNVTNEISIDTSHLDDSIRLGDGTNFLTSTTDNSKVALDVWPLKPSQLTIASVNVADSAVQISSASPSANRQKVLIYNNGNKVIYLGNNGVTTSNGFPLSPRAYIELEVGGAVSIYAISATTGNADIRVMELG